MKPLLLLNIFIASIDKYYQNNTQGFAYTKNDYVLEMKRCISKIASYPTELHPEKITEIKGLLRRLLPSHNTPVYFIYKEQLDEVFSACENFSKVKTF